MSNNGSPANSTRGIEQFSCTAHTEYLWPCVSGLIPRGRNLRVLDLGCGYGFFSGKLAELGHSVVGIDLAETSIRKARERYPEARFIKADILDIPPDALDGPFDLILSLEVIEHLFLPRALAGVVRKHLDPAGRWILSTPYHGYAKNLAISLLNGWDSHWNTLDEGWHIRFFSRKTLTATLLQEGFAALDIRCVGRLPGFWKSIVCSAELNPNAGGR